MHYFLICLAINIFQGVKMKGKEITDLEEAKKHVDYREFFRDIFVKEYSEILGDLYDKSKNEEERSEIRKNASVYLLNYGLIVYFLCGKKPGLKESIDAVPELKKNFYMIKRWLDKNNIEEHTREYLEGCAIGTIGKKSGKSG